MFNAAGFKRHHKLNAKLYYTIYLNAIFNLNAKFSEIKFALSDFSMFIAASFFLIIV